MGGFDGESTLPAQAGGFALGGGGEVVWGDQMFPRGWAAIFFSLLLPPFTVLEHLTTDYCWWNTPSLKGAG